MTAPINATSTQNDSSKSIILVSYPKIVMLYPTYITAIIAAVITMLLSEKSDYHQGVGSVFLGVMGVNLVVLAFDFPRTTSLNLFFVFLVLIMGIVLASIYVPSLPSALKNVVTRIDPRANAAFYFSFVAILSLLYVAMMINVRFDYWEVRPNELLHHHGALSNLERYSAPNLRISKEIDDVFEYMLLGSGRLIIHPSNEPRAFVLENVLGINKKETEITKMLGALQVQVRDKSE